MRAGYTKLVERAGSVLQMNEELDVSWFDAHAVGHKLNGVYRPRQLSTSSLRARMLRTMRPSGFLSHYAFATSRLRSS